MDNKVVNICLRRWREDDAEALFRIASDPRVSELALWPCHTSVDMSRAVIRDYFMPNKDCFAIVDSENDTPIGCIGLVPPGDEHYPVATGEREVGYWIGHDFWRQGLTTRALSMLIGYCTETLRLDSLLITADSTNIASHRVAIKCGFSHIADFTYNDIPSKAFKTKLPS